jgi:hypothetical protein
MPVDVRRPSLPLDQQQQVPQQLRSSPSIFHTQIGSSPLPMYPGFASYAPFGMHVPEHPGALPASHEAGVFSNIEKTKKIAANSLNKLQMADRGLRDGKEEHGRIFAPMDERHSPGLPLKQLGNPNAGAGAGGGMVSQVRTSLYAGAGSPPDGWNYDFGQMPEFLSRTPQGLWDAGGGAGGMGLPSPDGAWFAQLPTPTGAMTNAFNPFGAAGMYGTPLFPSSFASQLPPLPLPDMHGGGMGGDRPPKKPRRAPPVERTPIPAKFVESEPRITSKHRGVCWYRRTKKWVVQTKVNKKRVHVGYFSDEEEAAKAYLIAVANINQKGDVIKKIRELVKKSKGVPGGSEAAAGVEGEESPVSAAGGGDAALDGEPVLAAEGSAGEEDEADKVEEADKAEEEDGLASNGQEAGNGEGQAGEQGDEPAEDSQT